MKRAEFWERAGATAVRCDLCPHHCRIEPGTSGLCRVRKNQGGELTALSYGRISSIAVDPIEKKPLYHFFPGSSILSIGSVGCNLKCFYCQNWQISQASPETLPLAEMTPERVVEEAVKAGSIGVAYTYNEPFIWWEFVRDTALLARAHHLKNVLVTNGFVEKAPLQALLPLVDAMNIDLKAMDEDFYRKHCHGQLEPVLHTITLSRAAGVHLELTSLLVTGLNDGIEPVKRLVDWVFRLNPNIPLHLSRYFPHYQCPHPPTPVPVMEQAWTIARQKLPYVYLGNLSPGESAHTRCPGCQQSVVEREGYRVSALNLTNRSCGFCGHPIPIIHE